MLIQAVNTYLEMRRSCGFKLLSQGKLLKSFATFSDSRGKHYVCSDIAIQWAGLGGSAPQKARRLSEVTRFSRYLRAEDPMHQIPPPVFGVEKRLRPVPYIFSQDEIQGLITTALKLGPHPFRGKTYSALFSLLACTGLRVSEAIALRFKDITEDGLIIRRTKFSKSRLIPLHETAQSGIRRYMGDRLLYAPYNDHVFVSPQKNPVFSWNVYKAFTDAADKIGLHKRLDPPRPILHSFRHTFAVTALKRCTGSRDEITEQMLALSTYLGHGKIYHTYWYLEAVPELMADIAQKCENFFTGGKP